MGFPVRRRKSVRKKPKSTIQSSPKAAQNGTKEAPASSAARIALLRSRIEKMPLKTLHDYVLANLDSPSPERSESLLDVFESLKMPQKIHCARCHKDYFEDENTKFSCRMEHDDDTMDGDRQVWEWLCCGLTIRTVSPSFILVH